MIKKKILDWSHWQGNIDRDKLKNSDIDGIIIKISQGAKYRDPKAKEYYSLAKSLGYPVGAYHFVTNDNAIQQYDNFANGMEEIGEFDFIPAMDCEAFTSYKGEIVSIRELRTFVYPEDKFKILMPFENSVYFRNIKYPMFDEIYSLAYPSQDIVDVIGRRLIGGFDDASIYTNVGSGNRIFTKKIFGTRYRLWVANWGVEIPSIPAMWKGKQWMMHQKAVVDGAQYGIAGRVDYNEWGELLPFPNSEPEPPEPPDPTEDFIDGVIETNLGIYKGKLYKE